MKIIVSSLRLDNLKLAKITNNVEKIDMFNDDVVVTTYAVAARFSMETSNSSLEITETAESLLGTQFLWAKNASKIILNNGIWNLYTNWSKNNIVNNRNLYYIIV